MKPKRNLTAYSHSQDMAVNAALTLAKLFKRIRMSNPTYTPPSRYLMHLKSKQAARRAKFGIVR